ncbi:hypothetical protein ACSBPQ_07750 [Stenotrophomonas sp. JC08]|uniref:hypothetical protein n=1 Tax=Stenotrophomonas sp. JC08 TaxID=3445779 RepID=UPI003FA2CBD2
MILALVACCLVLIAYGFVGGSGVIAVILFCFAALIAYGAAGLFFWYLDRRDARIDADYRAARLVAISRAEVSK